MSAIVQIKNAIPIIDVMERYAGINFSYVRTSREKFNIRCPFHDDRNPSFTVYTDTNTFRCWSGCNKGKPGDVINIVELSQNVDTKEAIKLLITDYGLKKPDSEQAREWQKKRAYRERSVALKEEMKKKTFEAMDALIVVERSARDIVSTIRNENDLDRVGELYHVLIQIDYWFECIMDDRDTEGQIQALEEVSHFLQKMKEGEGA
ncbi:hypothetical protein HPY21_15475 [Bacillus stratosphericus]|nr:hypothetical protein [Bacillus stratosphericus]